MEFDGLSVGGAFNYGGGGEKFRGLINIEVYNVVRRSEIF